MAHAFSDRSRPLLFAHRGAAAERAENTLPSFQRALELGADALETDAHLTADGHVVLSHDPDGRRRAGVAAEIRRSTLAEVEGWDVGDGARIPTLEAVLRAFPEVPINVDLKQRVPDMTGPAVALVRRLGATERVLLTSFSTRTVRRLRALGYQGPLGLSRGEVLAILALPRWAGRRLVRPGDAAQLPLSLARPRVVERCHALGLRVDYWTVNDAATARRLLALGADGVMTDDPAAVAPAFGR
jgi:glycerophosphoryl diester phosphodiesterase